MMIEVLAVLQVHDVEAPEEIVEAPDVRSAADDLAGLGLQVEGGLFRIEAWLTPSQKMHDSMLAPGCAHNGDGDRRPAACSV